MKLLKALLKIQKREHISHVKMAAFFGISPQHWWRMRTGRNEFKADYKLKAVNRWRKELQTIFLSENVMYRNNSK